MPAYLEGELLPEKLLELEEHVATCPLCLRKLEELKRNRELLKEEGQKVFIAPRALSDRVLARVRRERIILKRRARRIKTGIIGFLLALGAASWAIFFRRRRKRI
jgi:anti-sigma factor RsiW